MTDDDLKSLFEDVKRHTGVIVESVRSEVRGVAEGLLNVNAKMDREFERAWREFDELKAMIKFSAADIDRRMTALEARVDRLESLVPGARQ